MSTETKPLKLMPHVKRTLPNGRVFIEPGAQSEFELPPEFKTLFEALEAGSSLSKLVDQVDSKKAGSRFRLIRKFLIFLDENDLLADRDYMRLAESLKPEYSWPTSILATEIIELPIVRASRRAGSSALTGLLLLITTGLALGSLAALALMPVPEIEEASVIRALVLLLVTMSAARSLQALWAFLTSAVSGSVANFDVVIEPLAFRLRQEQKGRPVRTLALLSNALSFVTMFGVAALLMRFAKSKFEFDAILIGGAFAFFTETSPYSRTSLTDLLKSLYANLEERASESGARERAIRNLHVAACFAWILFAGIFFVVDVWALAHETFGFIKSARGGDKIASFALLAVIALYALNWIADLLGSVSYDGASVAQVRQMWRRKKESPLDRVQGLAPSAQDFEKLPFLRQIPPEIRKSLLQAAQVRMFKEGQSIVHQNDKDRNLFVVLEGRLAVARTSTNAGASSRRKVVAWLDAGAVFGENAFFFGQPRSADIVGMDAGRLLVIPHTKDMKIIEAEQSEALRTRVWFLQALVQSQLFKELPSEALDAILIAGVEQRFTAGAKVIQEGEEADACYFMVQGRASVTQKFKAVAKINAGDAFGEISILFPGTLRTATITADTDLLTIRIDRERFWKLLKAHLPLALEIERLGLRRLKSDQARG